MVDVKTEIIIARPKREVVAFASNPDNTPKWYVNIKSAEWVTPKPLALGCKIAFKAKFLGRDLSYVYEVVKLNEGQMIMRTADGPFPMETTYTWEEISETETKMTLRNVGEPSGFSKVFAPMMASAMKKATTKDLILLKQILES